MSENKCYDFLKLYIQKRTDKISQIERPLVLTTLGEYYASGTARQAEFFKFYNCLHPITFPVENGAQKYEKKIFKYFQKGELNRIHYASYNLAVCYFKAIGTEKNLKQAHKYFFFADSNGDKRVYHHIHDCIDQLVKNNLTTNENAILAKKRFQSRQEENEQCVIV